MRSKTQQREFFKSKGEDQTEAVQIAENKLNELFLWFFFVELFFIGILKYFAKTDISQKEIYFGKWIFGVENLKLIFVYGWLLSLMTLIDGKG